MDVYALIKDKVVINRVVWDGQSHPEQFEGATVVKITDTPGPVDVGWKHDENENKFTK